MPSSDDTDAYDATYDAAKDHHGDVDQRRELDQGDDVARRREVDVDDRGVDGLPVFVTGDLDRAEAAVDRALVELDTAEDEVADLEGRIVVLESKFEAIDSDDSKEEWQRYAAREDLAKARRAFIRAGHRLGRAETKLTRAQARLDSEVDALAAAVTASEATEAAAAAAESGEAEPEGPRFASVDLFVDSYVLPNWVHDYARGSRWCDRWWEHAEAITRLEALWEAFEVMRLEPAPSLSTWLRDHFDVHMRTLTDPTGVFYKCDVKQGYHKPEPAWASVRAPHGMFAVIETAQIRPSTPDDDPGEAGAVDGAEKGSTRVSSASSTSSRSGPLGLTAGPLKRDSQTTTTTAGVRR